MPYKANEPRRHKIPRARYRIENWAEYDAAPALSGAKLRLTPSAQALLAREARQSDGLGDARGDRGLGAGGDRGAGPAAGLLGRRHRDRADAEAGVRSAVASDRGPARVDPGPAWPGVAGSGARQGQRSYHITFSAAASTWVSRRP